MKAGYSYDPIYGKHDTGRHPENADRLKAIISHLDRTGLRQRLIPIKPRAASIEELSLVHDERYILQIRDLAQKGGGWLGVDTVISSDSYEAALFAAGGVINATGAVIRREMDSAFALVRPPGHHATRAQAMGFCLFNNLAIAAECALVNYQLEHILIIDFDVHHGNGTQAAFYDDPRVLYISIHQYPFYPGTGSIEETGNENAEGTTINIPFPAGSGDSEYLEVFRQIIVPAAIRFKPQLVLVSAGYDSHWADELALMQLTVSGFAQMVKIIRGLSEDLCNGRLVFSLEGGYNLRALAASVDATFNLLLGKTAIENPLGQPPPGSEVPCIASLIRQLKELHNLA